MVLNYNKRDKYEILNSLNGYELEKKNAVNSENMLIFAENLHVLKVLINDFKLKGKIDLIYIDPPFATNNNFTITNGRASTISNSKNGDIAYSDTLQGADFIEFLRDRLVLIRELLSEQG